MNKAGAALMTGTLVVTCRLAAQQYGLPLAATFEVVGLAALTPLAGAPPTCCGLLNLRGQYLPVLNGRALVGAPAWCDLNSQILIAGLEKPTFGLLVDQVCDVCTVAAGRLAPIAAAGAAPFLSGVFGQDDESVLLLDPATLLELLPDTARSKAMARVKRRAAGMA